MTALPWAAEPGTTSTQLPFARAAPSARRRGSPYTGVLAIAAILLLLLEGIPTSAGVSIASVAPPSSPLAPSAASPGPYRTTVDRAPVPTSGAGYDSLCTLGVLPNCGARAALAFPTARAVALSPPDPPSSWANVTPPAGHANPDARAYPSMTYYPSAHDVILFGGVGLSNYDEDTWTYVNHNWTEVISNANCTASTCPSIRAGAMMAYYAPANGILLFGGFVAALGFVAAFNDTWLFSGGAWHNITATSGAAPKARYLAAMSWDPLDNDVMLFGGALATGSVEMDTWIFNGTWHNITAQVYTASSGHIPVARAGMSIAASPSGYLLMFGGEDAGGVLYDAPGPCYPLPIVAYWFHADAWTPMKYAGSCVYGPVTDRSGSLIATQPPGDPPPCGRVDPALGWSPKNQHFVLYGGYGPSSTTSTCSGSDVWLNDTYLYQNPPGAGFDWLYAGDSGDPANRSDMGFASDFTDGYFILFGGDGTGGTTLFNSTYRYYALVHARLVGPSTIDANTSDLSFNIPFVVTGFGGSGVLSYAFTIAKLHPGNSLSDRTGTGCSVLSNVTGNPVLGPLPYDGVASIDCLPTSTSFNFFRETVHVWDDLNVSDSATAIWTFEVKPPQTELVYSEFKTLFYTGFSFGNIFGVYAKVNGIAAGSVTGSLGSTTVTFQHVSAYWWNSTPVNMGGVSPGSVLKVTGDWNGWFVNASYTPQMVTTPSWLASLFAYTGAQEASPGTGAGPWNKTYTIYENYSWSVSSSSSFALPSPMVGGNYALIPAIAVAFSASSSGSLSLKGSLTSTFPKIDLGGADLKFSISIALSGKFQVLNDTQGISDVQWLSAKATISVSGDISASIPLYGFNILGVAVGFTLEIEVKATVALTFLLAPTTETNQEIINGIEVMMTQLIGAFTLALTVGVKFSIAIASVELGGTMSLAITFNATPSFYLTGGWLNGTVFGQAQFLFWTVEWDILGPAVIYSWTNPVPVGPAPTAPTAGAQCPTCHNNGQNATWAVQPRYYAIGSYDNVAWSASATAGPAVTDIYPFTEVTAAPAANGAYLFYSDDNAQVPVQQGLRVSGLRLDPSTNQLMALPSPNDPGFVVDQPKATTLPDGSLYVLWAALPASESNLPSPTTLSTLQLHGARFYPSNQSWGPIRTWSNWGLAEAYALDGSTAPGTLVELVAPTFLVGDSTFEQMVVYDLTTGKELSNLTVTGLSTIESVRAALGDAVVKNVGGNYSVMNLTSGGALPIAPPAVSNSHLISASFVTGSSSVLVLLYRNRNATQTILYDLLSQQVLETLSTDQSASLTAAALEGGSYYVFDGVRGGIAGWRGSGAFVTNLSLMPESNLQEFGLVRLGSSLLLYALVTNGNFTQPIVALEFAEVGGSPLNAPPTKTIPPSGSSGASPNYLLYLGIGAGADVLLLAVIALVGRRRGGAKGAGNPSTPSAPPTESPPPKPGAE